MYTITLTQNELARTNTKVVNILLTQERDGDTFTITEDALWEIIEVGEACKYEWDEKLTALCVQAIL
jgi:hypothetical protein